MDFPIPSFFVLFTLILFFLMVAKILHKPKTKNSISRLPPGPGKLPLIGNLHLLVGSLPHHSLRNLANKYGPLMHLQLGEVSNIVVSSSEMAKEIMKTHDIIFANRPFLLGTQILSYDSTDIAFAPYGDYWRQLRKICTMELLSQKRVQYFRSIREEEISNLVKAICLSEGSEINLSKRILSLSYGITARAAFGKKSKDEKEFISIVKQASKVTSGFCVADYYPSIKMLQHVSGLRKKLEKLHREIDRILGNIIEEHREDMTKLKQDGDGVGDLDEDLVDVLLKLQKSGDLDPPLTDNNIKAVLLDIFSAGSETSSTAIDWAMSELLKRPKLMEKAQEEVRRVYYGKENIDETHIHELKFLTSVIKETLRLHPPAPLLLPRESSKSCVIGGYEIPAKTKVIVNGWAIGRDPKCWEEAEKFYPERFLDSLIDYKGADFEFIPFGAGRRICPGMSFATAVVELTLAKLLYHFDWKFPGDMLAEDLDMTESFGLAVGRKMELQLIPIPYPSLPR
ncbi:hypothetical protein UlMin_004791 [Ulmus minor]